MRPIKKGFYWVADSFIKEETGDDEIGWSIGFFDGKEWSIVGSDELFTNHDFLEIGPYLGTNPTYLRKIKLEKINSNVK